MNALPVMTPPALWQVTIARRYPGHWCFDQRGREMTLLLAPAAHWPAWGVVIRPGYWVLYEPRPGVYYGRALCDSLDAIPRTVAEVLRRTARRPAHGEDRDLLINGHTLSGGHPAWLRAAIDALT